MSPRNICLSPAPDIWQIQKSILIWTNVVNCIFYCARHSVAILKVPFIAGFASKQTEVQVNSEQKSLDILSIGENNICCKENIQHNLNQDKFELELNI